MSVSLLFKSRPLRAFLAGIAAVGIAASGGCGGGGSSSSSTSSTSSSSTSSSSSSGASSSSTSSSSTSSSSSSSGFIGTCPVLGSGVSASPAYELGYCSTPSASTPVYEAVYQTKNIVTTELPPASGGAPSYSIAFPSDWGGTIVLGNGQPNSVATFSQLGNLGATYAVDRFIAATSPARDETSIIDYSSLLLNGASRVGTFGLWGRSKQNNEVLYGAFYGPSVGTSATPSSVLATGVDLSKTGSAVTWYLYNASVPAASGTLTPATLSATMAMTISRGTTPAVTGTLSNFFQRISGPPVVIQSIPIAAVTLTGVMTAADGSFSGVMTGGITGVFRGVVIGAAGDQFVGQFAGKASDGRFISGAFGLK